MMVGVEAVELDVDCCPMVDGVAVGMAVVEEPLNMTSIHAFSATCWISFFKPSKSGALNQFCFSFRGGDDICISSVRLTLPVTPTTKTSGSSSWMSFKASGMVF
jgi:hypothetical protein